MITMLSQLKQNLSLLPEGLTAEDVLFNYVMAQTSTTSIDDAKKSLRKLNLLEKKCPHPLMRKDKHYHGNDRAI